MKKAKLSLGKLQKHKRIRKNKKNYFRGAMDKSEIKYTYSPSQTAFDIRYLVLFGLLGAIFVLYTPLTYLATKLPSVINISTLHSFITTIHMPQINLPVMRITLPYITFPVFWIRLPQLFSIEAFFQNVIVCAKMIQLAAVTVWQILSKAGSTLF